MRLLKIKSDYQLIQVDVVFIKGNLHLLKKAHEVEEEDKDLAGGLRVQ